MENANSALALPSMTARDGVVYAAYRSFNLLRFSDQLQVIAYDVNAHKQLHHVTIPVPKVHGERAAEGLFLSEDGKMLAYSETYNPTLLLLLSTKDLSEIRRSTVLPFTPEDLWRQFGGFDSHDRLAFASVKSDRLRFIRINPTDLDPVSDASMSGPEVLEPFSLSIVWSPSAKLTWISSVSMRGDLWQEYGEGGHATGQVSGYRREISNGAVALGEGKLLAFYGNMIAKGSVVRYSDHKEEELKLTCVPSSYGISNDPQYAGAICATMTDLAEPAQNRTVTSDFLLLRTKGPTVVWRHKMDFVGVANGNEPHSGGQKGNPLIYRAGSKLLIMAPTRRPELAVYEVPLEEGGVTATTHRRTCMATGSNAHFSSYDLGGDLLSKRVAPVNGSHGQ
ncbi:MAG TPA: hypothetical protein VG028_15090 [Terriglobia bacterium]|nr:hypothetical protein [Terriglobia bacterium]